MLRNILVDGYKKAYINYDCQNDVTKGNRNPFFQKSIKHTYPYYLLFPVVVR